MHIIISNNSNIKASTVGRQFLTCVALALASKSPGNWLLCCTWFKCL